MRGDVDERGLGSAWSEWMVHKKQRMPRKNGWPRRAARSCERPLSGRVGWTWHVSGLGAGRHQRGIFARSRHTAQTVHAADALPMAVAPTTTARCRPAVPRRWASGEWRRTRIVPAVAVEGTERLCPVERVPNVEFERRQVVGQGRPPRSSGEEAQGGHGERQDYGAHRYPRRHRAVGRHRGRVDWRRSPNYDPRVHKRGGLAGGPDRRTGTSCRGVDHFK